MGVVIGEFFDFTIWPKRVTFVFLVALGQDGGVAEWPKAAVLKTVERKLRGFESYLLRSFFNGEMAEWPKALAC